MPWRNIRLMDSKIQFISLALGGQITMTELCSIFCISRKTGYKWLGRYLQEGPKGLENKSSAPKHIPHKTQKDVIDFIVSCRKKHPSWGARKITQKAKHIANHLTMPSEATINNIIKREGLANTKRKRRKLGHPGTPSVSAESPNDIWTADFKGEFKTKNGKYCYPLTILDEYSRFLIDCQGLPSNSFPGSFRIFKKAFKKYGLPNAIKSDNGAPFATTALGRLSKLSVWWIKLGIDPVLIQPASPYQNGVHERMHRTLKNESTIPPSGDLKAQQQRFNRWKKEYNFERPHETLKGKYPSQVYKPSLKEYPSKIPPVEYPSHFEVRLVSRNKCLSWKQQNIPVSSTLIHEYIGLEEIMDGIWSVYFSWKRLGFLDENKMCIIDDLGRIRRKKM